MSGLFGGGGQTISTTTPVIAGFRVQSSAYAGAIARIFGKTRVAANLMWYGDFTAIPHTTTTSSGGGGKGGGEVTQSNTTYTYTAASLLLIGRGVINAVPRVWRDKEQTTLAALGLSLYTGSAAQTPFPHLSTNHPAEALAYRGLAYVASAALDLGDNASLGNHTFEVEGELPFSGTIKDANPRDVLEALLLEAGLDGDFIGNLAAFSDYCVANGIFIAPAYTQQQSAAEAIATLARIGNAEVVCSEELIKLVPYSDQAASGNGATYTPDVAPLFEFTDDDFLSDNGDSPVRFEDDDTSDAFNIVTVQYYNRAKDYAEDVVQARDDDHIALYGERPMDPITLHEIVDTDVARLVAQVELQRQLYYRMRYRYSLGPGKADLLEPMDVVAITNAELGLDALPVRILEIEEIEDEERDGFRFYVREFPAGVGAAVVYPSESGLGYTVDYNVAAGNALPPVVIEPPVELTTTGLELWIGVTGPADSKWGGAHVWVSLDGSTYKRIGTARAPARIGHLTANLAAGSSGPAALQLDGLGGAMNSATPAEAEALATLLYIAGATPEYIAYEGATLTGANAYSLTTLTRGAYGSHDSAHASGATVARVDAAIVKGDPLDLDWIDRTVYIKLQSYNIFGGGTQELADLTPHAYTVTGAMVKLPPPNVASLFIDGARLTWPEVTNSDHLGYRIRFKYGANLEWGTANPMHVGLVTESPFPLQIVPPGQVTIMIRAVDALYIESEASAYVITDFGDTPVANVVESYDFKAATWPGSYTGATLVGGNLQAGQPDAFYKADASNFYGNDGAPFYSANYAAMEWTSSGWTPSLAAAGSNMTIVWALTGEAPVVQYRPTGPLPFYADDLSYFYGVDADPFYDAPPDWSAWPGSLVARNQEYQWRVSTSFGPTTGLLSAFTVSVDVPDKTLLLNGVAIGSGGTRLAGAIGEFNVIQNIQITLQGGSSAMKVEASDYNNPLGPLIDAKNSSGGGVAATIDALLQGY